MTHRTNNTNRKLTAARKAKRDEFYTTREVIEAEVPWYEDDFKGRPVLCNCNDWPRDGYPRSEFVQFFMRKMASWNIPKLIAVGYEGSAGSLFEKGHGTLYELTNDGRPADKPYTEDDFKVTRLEGTGGFETPECEPLLDIPDVIVCTNPAFSTLKKYIPMLDRHGTDFLIIAPINAATYSEVFPLFMEGKCWLGLSVHGGERKFYVPEQYADKVYGYSVDENGHAYAKVGMRWFTNLPCGKTDKNDLSLEGNSYYAHPEKYPKYDNYDAINVDRVADTPEDFLGPMGVPVTWLDHWCSSGDGFAVIGRDVENAGPVVEREREKWCIRNASTSTADGSTTESSSDVRTDRGAETWQGRPVRQGDTSSGRANKVHETAHPTFRLLGTTDNGCVPERLKKPWPKPHNEPYIDGRKRYTRLIIQRI